MAKILITGASGMLGRVLMRSFPAHIVVGTAFTRANPPLLRLNLCDPASIREFVGTFQPEIIIHCAAERRPDSSEKDPERTFTLNVTATDELARIGRSVGAWILYVSTDYVFDGSNPPYAPSDPPNPLNLYGKSKLLGEKVLQEVSPDATILRVGLLYGRVEFAGESAVTALLKEIHGQEPVKIDDWARRYPTFTDDIAVLCRQFIEHKLQNQDVSGIWHWSGNEVFSKYEMAKRIAEVIGVKCNHLEPDRNPPKGTVRPKDCRMDCTALESRGMGVSTPFMIGMRTVLDALNQHQA